MQPLPTWRPSYNNNQRALGRGRTSATLLSPASVTRTLSYFFSTYSLNFTKIRTSLFELSSSETDKHGSKHYHANLAVAEVIAHCKAVLLFYPDYYGQTYKNRPGRILGSVPSVTGQTGQVTVHQGSMTFVDIMHTGIDPDIVRRSLHY